MVLQVSKLLLERSALFIELDLVPVVISKELHFFIDQCLERMSIKAHVQ